MRKIWVLISTLNVVASMAAARMLTGSGPAYWQEPSTQPMHYPAAASAVEGFVLNPAGGLAFCNARVVKPVCTQGVWVQNLCIARLQALQVAPDNNCLQNKEVFGTGPAPGSTAALAASVMQPIPVTAADMNKHSNKGLIFRGIAAAELANSWAVREVQQATPSHRSRSIIDSHSHFWWSSPIAANQDVP